MDKMIKIKICSGILAVGILFPGYAMAAVYRSSTDTGVDVLDYIENNRRAERENRLDDDQKQLVQDTAEMKEHLHEPLDGTKRPVPSAFEGDDLVYDVETGAVSAKGNVKITQIDEHRFTTDEATGNLKTQDVDIKGKAHMLQLTPGMQRIKVDGYKTQFNYGTDTGKMEDVTGKIDHQYIKGQRVEFYPDKTIIYNGSATKCAAQHPDYHISADKIVIYPKDKIVMTNAKFWLGKMVLYTKKEYVIDITPGAKGPQYPRFGYSDDDGFWLSQVYTADLMPNVQGYFDFLYTGKYGFRNVLGVGWNTPHNSYQLQYGYFEDSNNHWIKKQPTFKYDYSNHMKTQPFSYGFSYELGNWYDNGIHSTHTYYSVSLTRDTITICPGSYLFMGTSYSITKESYHSSTVKGFNYDVTFVRDPGNRWAAYAGYHYTQNNSQNSLFNYGVDDYSKKFEIGCSYRFDDKNRIVIGENFDVQNNRLKDVDYYWYHDIHCAQLILRYRAKRHNWNIGVQFTPW